MAKIFISYRRDDSQYPADLLHKALAPHVDNPKEDIFIDVDNIPLGVNFVEYLDEKVSQCEVLLALIGPRWASATDERGNRRLDNPEDFVRIEIASALKRGIPVVPVLLDGAPVPRAEDLPDDLKELAVRNGEEIRRASFDGDAERLIRKLGLATENARIPTPGSNAYWDEIKETLEAQNYQNFIDHFSDHPQTFEAHKRIRQLNEYAAVDTTDAYAIADFRKRKSETDPLFDALEAHTKREMDRAARSALSDQKESSKETESNNQEISMPKKVLFGIFFVLITGTAGLTAGSLLNWFLS